MLDFGNNVYLIERPEEFVAMPISVDTFYGDLETTSGDQKLDSLIPWKKEQCKVHCGAFTWDKHAATYVVPNNLIGIFLKVLSKAKRWVNHNVKYDSHVLYNQYKLDIRAQCVDTLTQCKIVDSDRMFKGGYGLDVVCKHFCNIDLSPWYNALNPYLYKFDASGKKKQFNHDYGRIPLEKLADYAGNQVKANRVLHDKLNELMPEECKQVWETEQRLTETLIKMERRGMIVNVLNTRIANLKAQKRMILIWEELKDKLGYYMNPKSQPDCEDLFINRFGLPPIYKEDKKTGEPTGGPSFAKAILELYAQVDYAPKDIVELIQEYRHLDTMQGIFYNPWIGLNVIDDDGHTVLHPNNNQCVRTGRMSCSDPNATQLNNEARALIEPRPGYSFIVHDYSQIEYRYIAHYLKNERLLQAYANDPDVDFHRLQAESVVLGDAHLDRDSAKTLNFSVSFGQGKKKTTIKLMLNKFIAEAAKGDKNKIRELAEFTYNEFFRKLPELKPHRKMAENAARRQGYVRNIYGRRRHLDLVAAHLGFPSVVQGTAADLIKERANALDEVREKYGAHLIGLVHDEVLSEAPTEVAEEYSEAASECLNQPSVPVLVPIRSKCGISQKNWLEAKKRA